MSDIKVIFPPIEELVLLNAGCACEIIIPEGFVHGPKLAVIIDPDG